MSNEELKPCPFYSSEAMSYEGDEWSVVGCFYDDCYINPHVGNKTIEGARAIWNIRDGEKEVAELREHLENLITESTMLAEFKNETLRKGICSTDLDEPEWHDYQTIGEAAECLGKLLNK